VSACTAGEHGGMYTAGTGRDTYRTGLGGPVEGYMQPYIPSKWYIAGVLLLSPCPALPGSSLPSPA